MSKLDFEELVLIVKNGAELHGAEWAIEWLSDQMVRQPQAFYELLLHTADRLKAGRT